MSTGAEASCQRENARNPRDPGYIGRVTRSGTRPPPRIHPLAAKLPTLMAELRWEDPVALDEVKTQDIAEGG
ncbi:MAG: hypothetical protein KJO07_13130, partial [Deltaproteobacteria bacterium]|nr:hypothetical protein [Deltaproteobacteria bacterium]